MYEEMLAQQAGKIRQLQELESWRRVAQANPQGYQLWYNAMMYQQQYHPTPQQQRNAWQVFAQSPQQQTVLPSIAAYANVQGDGNLNAKAWPGSPDIVEMILSPSQDLTH